MHSIKRILSLSLAVAAFGVAHGANVAITTLAAGPAAQPAKKIVTTTGANVPQTSIVRIGFFNLPGGNDTSVLAGTSFSALQAMFTPVGEDPVATVDGTTGPVRVNATGGVLGSIQNIDNAFMPAGRELYAWVFAQPTADATAAQWAIFRDSTWLMPDGGSLATINLQTWQIDQSAEVFAGTLNSANNLIVMVPEPGSALLGLIGLGLALRRRRA